MKKHEASNDRSHYARLAIMIVLSFASMYVFMYAMVNSATNVLPNINQFYMAGLMTAPMIIIEMALMGSMYPQKRWNAAILIASVVALSLFWMFIRTQTAVSDRQFLKSMIPHHGAAILMCGQASLQDAEIKALCGRIIASQQSEIDLMKRKLQ
jgi:uncharacterized protein (DUF305 family)